MRRLDIVICIHDICLLKSIILAGTALPTLFRHGYLQSESYAIQATPGLKHICRSAANAKQNDLEQQDLLSSTTGPSP